MPVLDKFYYLIIQKFRYKKIQVFKQINFSSLMQQGYCDYMNYTGYFVIKFMYYFFFR